MAGHKYFVRFLDCMDNSFLLQVTEDSMRRGYLLDLIPSNNERPLKRSAWKSPIGSGSRRRAQES